MKFSWRHGGQNHFLTARSGKPVLFLCEEQLIFFNPPSNTISLTFSSRTSYSCVQLAQYRVCCFWMTLAVFGRLGSVQCNRSQGGNGLGRPKDEAAKQTDCCLKPPSLLESADCLFCGSSSVVMLSVARSQTAPNSTQVLLGANDPRLILSRSSS